jgi:hypothetical protein
MGSKLVGVSMREEGEDRQLNVRALRDDQKLFWKHEKENLFDPNAIKVYADEQMTHALGYVQKELARDLVQQMRELGIKYEIYCSKVTGGSGRTYGCNIKIVVVQ